MDFTREEMLIAALGETPLEVCERLVELGYGQTGGVCPLRRLLEASTGRCLVWYLGGLAVVGKYNGPFIRVTGAVGAVRDLLVAERFANVTELIKLLRARAEYGAPFARASLSRRFNDEDRIKNKHRR